LKEASFLMKQQKYAMRNVQEVEMMVQEMQLLVDLLTDETVRDEAQKKLETSEEAKQLVIK
jgi:hypothetical protein